MPKLSLPLLLAVALPWPTSQNTMPDPHNLEFRPSPLTSGGTGEIHYDGPDGTKIKIDFGDEVIEVEIQNGKATFNVPTGAGSVLAVDPWDNTATTTYGP